MADTSTDTTTDVEGAATDTEGGQIDQSEVSGNQTPGDNPESGNSEDTEPDTFPREVVEKLRQENGKYRQRAQQADAYAQRLHTALVAATGRLADPTDLPFDAEHLADDGVSLAQAIDALLERKPHLASRTPVGDVGQGPRGTTSEPFSLLSLLKSRT